METSVAPVLELFDIPGFEDKYCATKDGRIYSLKRNMFLTFGDDTYNYSTVSLNNKTYKVHRIMAQTFLENPENHPHVDHINRDRKDNSINNLRYASLSQNQLNKSKSTKDPKYRNITFKKTTFKVTIKRKNKNTIYKTFKTLKDAIDFRDANL